MKESPKSMLMLSLSLLATLAVFGIWVLVAQNHWVSPLFLPSPFEVWKSFLHLAFGDGYGVSSLWVHLLTSLGRIGVAFIFCTLIAVPLGLACGFLKPLHALLAPFVHFYRPLPPLAYYTLLILWFGIDELSKISLLFLAGFAPIFIACASSVEQIPQSQLTVAKTLGASGWRLFTYVILPSALPGILVGLRTALGFIYTTLVAAEMVAASSGIGWMVLDASKFLKSDVIFVGIIAMGLTGIVIEIGFHYLQKWLVPWNGKE